MLLRSQQNSRNILIVIDGTLAGASIILAYYLRISLIEPLDMKKIATVSSFAQFSPLLALMGPFLLYRLGFYNLGIQQDRWQVINLASQCTIILFLVMVALQFFLKQDLSRLVFVFFVPICTLILVSREIALWQIRKRLSQNHENLRGLILVSDEDNVDRWKAELHEHPEWGFALRKHFTPEELILEDFLSSMHETAVQLVVFDIDHGELQSVARAIRACEDEGIEAWLTADFFQTRVARAKVGYYGTRPLLIFQSTPDSSWQLLMKELFDRVGAAFLIFCFAPVLLLIALLIQMSSRGPSIFLQKRSGHYGQPFIMYKFRSMVSDAEQRKAQLQQDNEMNGPVFKVTHDPRITPIGKWLRKTSLDELPQLFNVLKGDMSLVGPRPLPVSETLAISENAQRRRLSMKPGITCLWQISGRNEIQDFKDWVRLDLKYIDNWSFWLDLEILLKTIPVVLRGSGAR